MCNANICQCQNLTGLGVSIETNTCTDSIRCPNSGGRVAILTAAGSALSRVGITWVMWQALGTALRSGTTRRRDDRGCSLRGESCAVRSRQSQSPSPTGLWYLHRCSKIVSGMERLVAYEAHHKSRLEKGYVNFISNSCSGRASIPFQPCRPCPVRFH